MAEFISLISNAWLIFLIVIIAIVIAIVVLFIFERRMRDEFKRKKNEEQNFFLLKTRELASARLDSRAFLNSFDQLARQFFKEKLGLDVGLKYSDFVEIFKKNKLSAGIKFCDNMQTALYAGERITVKNKDVLLKSFESLIGYVLRLERRTNPEEDARSVHANLVDYIKKGIRKGYDVNYLKRRLLGSGFGTKEVEKAVSEITSAHEKVSEEKIKKAVRMPKEIYVSKGSAKDILERRESKYQKKISSLDDLSRLKKKIKMRVKFSEKSNLV